MRLIDAAGIIFSHNDIIALWEKEEEHDVLIWYGMAWNIPKEYQNIERWQIFGAIQDKITESDRINIAINDAVTLPLAADAEPVWHGKWIEWNGMDIPENHGRHKCSICGNYAIKPKYGEEILTKRCPNCGCKMDGE